MRVISTERAISIFDSLKQWEMHKEQAPFIFALHYSNPRPKTELQRVQCVDWLDSLLKTDYNLVDRDELRLFRNWLNQVPLYGQEYEEKRRMDIYKNVSKHRAG